MVLTSQHTLYVEWLCGSIHHPEHPLVSPEAPVLAAPLWTPHFLPVKRRGGPEHLHRGPAHPAALKAEVT